VTSSSEDVASAQSATREGLRLLALMRCPSEDALQSIQGWAVGESRKDMVWGRRSTNEKSTGTTG
jgi:hypothetical protein